MATKSLKQLQIAETQKKVKVKKIEAELKKLKGELSKIQKDIPVQKKKEDAIAAVKKKAALKKKTAVKSKTKKSKV